MVMYFGIFIVLFHKSFHWKIIIAVFLTPMILMFIYQKKEVIKSNVLLKEKLILAYDYEIVKNNENNENYLKCYFWDGQEKVILWKPKLKTFQLLALKNNQIFYKNQQLTFDNSHKLKSMLIDQKYILYLSDYGRGIGFYTLYKINLP